MLILILGDGEQLVRLTTLKSLFQTNLEDLTLKLGGLFQRKVYHFPCRRELQLGKVEAEAMQVRCPPQPS